MKIRNGFVSNSSSSSFIISKGNLSEEQIKKIKNHISCAKEMNETGEYSSSFIDCLDDNDRWSVIEKDEVIEVYTIMDNFDMYDFLINIGVDDNDIESVRY